MKTLFISLVATSFLMTGIATATVNKTTSRSNTQHNTVATPKPTPTPKRSHMAVKGSGVPTCANGIRYVSSTGTVICNAERMVTPKPTHKPL